MLKKLKNFQIMELVEGFKKVEEIKVVKPNKRFNYAVALNLANLTSNVKAIVSISSPHESYRDYEQKRQDIIAKYAELDANDKIVLIDSKWVKFKSDDDREKAKTEIKDLETLHTEVLEQRQKDLQDFDELLEVEVEVQIQTVNIDDIPDEVGGDLSLMKVFIPMIES